MSPQTTRQFKWYNLVIVIAMSLGSMSYGYSASIIGSTLAQPSFLKYMKLDTNPNATSLISTMNGLYQVGGFFGVFTVSFFADRWGRRVAIGVSALTILISGALLAGSANVAMFIVFRVVNGAGAFMILSAVPIWMNEVVPPKNRGAMVDFHGASLLFGYAVSAWVGFGFFHLHNSQMNVWRAPMAFQCLPPLLCFCLCFVLPESPRWLLMKDRYEEAKSNLLRMHSPEEARVELEQINKQMQIDRNLPNSYWIMFKKPSYRKRSLLALGTTCTIQFSGILVINNYATVIYGNLGYNANRQLLFLAAWLTLAWGCGTIGILLVDYFPRPKFMGYGMLLCMSCLIVEAALVANFATGDDLLHPNSSALKAAVAMFFVYVIWYEICLDGPQFAYIGELFPTHLRPKGMNIAVAMISLMNIIWLQAAPKAFQNIGWRYYLCFIIPGSLGALLMIFYYPDTKDRALEETAALFGDLDELPPQESEAEKTSASNETELAA